MHLVCSHCRRTLELAGERPSFCPYCGKSLGGVTTTNVPVDQEVTRPDLSAGVSARPPEPTNLGGYRIVRRLGGGGMGAVFEAEESSTGQRVAVKVISAEFARSAVAVERFRQEGRLASMIVHPRCVFVVAAEEEAGRPYIVMELVSGVTLQEHVDKQGPLAVADAVAKILDVIEGLQEAHRLGVVHRDVKPSNCFLLDDGRVKVGDFGLSKSLVSNMDLTKTGTFLGTLLYASPEQIKGERIDFRTDVYSAAATLFFLLTGQAPFQGKDGAATLARTISDPLPSLRKLRPEVSRALEKVILRGLERNPDKRHRTMEDFRVALLRFAPRGLSIGALGLRAGAFILDYFVYGIAAVVLFQLIGTAEDLTTSYDTHALATLLLLAYYAIFEGLWGASLGKRLFRLRVYNAWDCEPPGVPRAAWRAVAFYVVSYLVADLAGFATGADDQWNLWSILGVVWLPLGFLLMVSTMRNRNGYRCLHEFLSGTRVVSLPWPRKAESFTSRRPSRLLETTTLVDGQNATVGPYLVLGAIGPSADDHFVLADDPALGRRVLLQMHATAAAPLDADRRNIHRPTRLRWLSAGRTDDGQAWDAFVAPAGCPLPDLCDPDHPLSWRSFRGILEQLTEELAAACADGTLPLSLTVDQVWVQPNGRIQLLDKPLCETPSTARPHDHAEPQVRSINLLGDATRLALARRRSADSTTPAVAAPLPEHAQLIVRRLLDDKSPYPSVAALQEELQATHDRPTEVNRTLRSAHLLVQTSALLLPLALIGAILFAMTCTDSLQWTEANAAEPVPPPYITQLFLLLGIGIAALLPSIWVVWALIFRGGMTLGLSSLTLVCSDGAPASRLRCAWRAAIVWAPLFGLYVAAVIVKAIDPFELSTPMTLWFGALAYLMACLGIALGWPARGPHDWLAGTWLVPK